jgi:hypothetical protein
MSHVLKDRVKETTAVVGLGSATLLGAVANYHAFSVIGNTNTTYYAIIHKSIAEWETGIGTYTLAGTLISRDTVLDSSAAGAKVNFSPGTKDVICTYPASKAVFQGGDLGVPLTGNLVNCTGVPFNAAKNRIINGAMKIDQRNAGALITPGNGVYSADRWKCFLTQPSKYTIQQNSTSSAPGFPNGLGIISLSAYSVLPADYFILSQVIEGNNVRDFNWGTANAAPVTLSFWVTSSIAGIYGGSIVNGASNRSYPFTYTINTPFTWERKTITIPGCPDGTWLIDTGSGLVLYFGIGVGSNYLGTPGAWSSTTLYSCTGATSLVGTNSSNFIITGIQLEKGSIATDFDYINYTSELLSCQRYCQAISINGRVMGSAVTATNGRYIFMHTVPTRVPVSSLTPIGTLTNNMITNGAFTDIAITALTYSDSTEISTTLSATCASGLTVGQGSTFKAAAGRISLNADF